MPEIPTIGNYVNKAPQVAGGRVTAFSDGNARQNMARAIGGLAEPLLKIADIGVQHYQQVLRQHDDGIAADAQLAMINGFSEIESKLMQEGDTQKALEIHQQETDRLKTQIYQIADKSSQQTAQRLRKNIDVEFAKSAVDTRGNLLKKSIVDSNAKLGVLAKTYAENNDLDGAADAINRMINSPAEKEIMIAGFANQSIAQQVKTQLSSARSSSDLDAAFDSAIKTSVEVGGKKYQLTNLEIAELGKAKEAQKSQFQTQASNEIQKLAKAYESGNAFEIEIARAQLSPDAIKFAQQTGVLELVKTPQQKKLSSPEYASDSIAQSLLNGVPEDSIRAQMLKDGIAPADVEEKLNSGKSVAEPQLKQRFNEFISTSKEITKPIRAPYGTPTLTQVFERLGTPTSPKDYTNQIMAASAYLAQADKLDVEATLGTTTWKYVFNNKEITPAMREMFKQVAEQAEIQDFYANDKTQFENAQNFELFKNATAEIVTLMTSKKGDDIDTQFQKNGSLSDIKEFQEIKKRAQVSKATKAIQLSIQ